MNTFVLQEDEAKVKKAFQTMLTYIGNVARSPNEDKFRKIRLTNATFQVCSFSHLLRSAVLTLCIMK